MHIIIYIYIYNVLPQVSGQRLCNLVNDILDAASLRNDALRLVEDDVRCLSHVRVRVMSVSESSESSA